MKADNEKKWGAMQGQLLEVMKKGDINRQHNFYGDMKTFLRADGEDDSHIDKALHKLAKLESKLHKYRKRSLRIIYN